MASSIEKSKEGGEKENEMTVQFTNDYLNQYLVSLKRDYESSKTGNSRE